ncbi:hypothetical protein L1049_020588 [Liquidambar formosana]|uniref:Uncharacterized protein n=1 Tax=Liquidambar formosana TaxID=63359 RepID=A0AAP0X9Z0_LIQFO
MSREWPHFPDLHHLSGDDPSLHLPDSTSRQASQVLPPDLIIGDDPPLHSPSSHGKPAAFVIYSLSSPASDDW